MSLGSGGRIDLNCSFAEKDQARALGARWDAAGKRWYVNDTHDLRPFLRWLSPQMAALVRAQPSAPQPSAGAKPWVRLRPEQTRTPDGTPMDEEWVDENAVTYGVMSVEIKGCQYYQGVIHAGELANLVREPSNQYDSNAIRVDNLLGTQVGHLGRGYAAVLAPLLDDPSPAAPKVEIYVPWEPTSKFDVKAELKLIGPTAFADATAAALKVGGYMLRDGWLAEQAGAAGLAAREAVAAGLAQRSAASSSSSSTARPPPPSVQVVRLDPTQSMTELDRLFEKELAEQQGLSTEPAATALSASIISTTLLPHQLQALAWMLVREDAKTPPPASIYEQKSEGGRPVWFCHMTNSSSAEKPTPALGGLLADDMGLGKTIQMLSLIAISPPAGIRFQPPPAEVAEMAVLVVDVPMAATATSESGAAEAVDVEEVFDGEEALRSAKRLKVQDLRAQLATYGEEEHGNKPNLVERLVRAQKAKAAAEAVARAAEVAKAKAASAVAAAAATAGVPSAPNKIGRREGEHAAGCGGTLVVCPTSVLANWQEQLAEHVAEGALRVVTWHGGGRGSLEAIASADVVLTTYGTLASDWSTSVGVALDAVPSAASSSSAAVGAPGVPAVAGGKRKDVASMYQLQWHRIVLDEAHNIKNRNTQQCKAVLSLKGERRWALTGTPMPNRAEELQPLFAFLRAPPACDASLFKRTVSQPIKSGDPNGLARLRVLLKAISMRRTKALLTSKLPPREVAIHYVRLHDSGHGGAEDYEAVHAAAAMAVRALAKANDFTARMHILESILRLRQLCAAPALVSSERIRASYASLSALGDHVVSAGASEGLSVATAKQLLESLKGSAGGDGGECGDGGDGGDGGEGGATEEPIEYAGCTALKGLPLPPKVERLVEEVRALPRTERAVVFSQFTGVLDICADALGAVGVSCCRIDGGVAAARRVQILRTFGCDSGGPTVMLCSLKAAGVGLNLTRANHAFLLDPWWNASIEEQAFDRIHRIGQTRPVRVVRYVAKYTVEQRMIELQEAKSAQAKGALARLSEAEQKRANMQDLCKLFDGFKAELAAERRQTLSVQNKVAGSTSAGEANLEEVKRALPEVVD